MKIENSIKSLSKYFYSVGIFILFFTGLVLPAFSRPFRLEKLPDFGKKFGCGTCHINSRGGGPLNHFGEDYKDIGLKNRDKYTKSLGTMDSDGDGFSNDDEFVASTHPGDSKSRPK
jgi:hypothetical protein